jgi:hypothetical protein
MIPEQHTAAVLRGLREAFGVAEFEDVRMLKGLAESLVLRIAVRNSPYLLKISSRTNDPARHYSCMTAAADAGLAPRVWYTSVEDKVSITDFVQTVPLSPSEARRRIPALLRDLHALPRFPGVPHALNTSFMFLLHPGPALDAFLPKLRAAIPEPQREEFFAHYTQLAAAYPHPGADMVSSHNDLFKPDNILFDGSRVSLIDWEAAFLNDRYADLAVVANMIVSSDEEAAAFLREYFGAAPDAYQRARLFLAQQAAHMFYAMVFLMLGSAGQPIDGSPSTPGYQAFHQRFWTGEIELSDQPSKLAYGRVHLEQSLNDTRQVRFEAALRIVAGRQPEAGS